MTDSSTAWKLETAGGVRQISERSLPSWYRPLQIIGKCFDEVTVLKVADAFECNTEGHLQGTSRSPDDRRHRLICLGKLLGTS
jgi:hypothetical protein